MAVTLLNSRWRRLAVIYDQCPPVSDGGCPPLVNKIKKERSALPIICFCLGALLLDGANRSIS